MFISGLQWPPPATAAANCSWGIIYIYTYFVRRHSCNKGKALSDSVTLFPLLNEQARIGHFVEAQILESIEVDYIDESEVLTMADEDNHINKRKFTVPFVCGCRNLGEALVSLVWRSRPECGTSSEVSGSAGLKA